MFTQLLDVTGLQDWVLFTCRARNIWFKIRFPSSQTIAISIAFFLFCNGFLSYLTLHSGFLDRGVFLLAIAVRNLFCRHAGDLRNFKVLLDESNITLLPCHWLTVLVSSPILVALESCNVIKSILWNYNLYLQKSWWRHISWLTLPESLLLPVDCKCNT